MMPAAMLSASGRVFSKPLIWLVYFFDLIIEVKFWFDMQASLK
jgi:hypothetical protein